MAKSKQLVERGWAIKIISKSGKQRFDDWGKRAKSMAESDRNLMRGVDPLCEYEVVPVEIRELAPKRKAVRRGD